MIHNEWEEQPSVAKPAALVEAESKLQWALYFSRGLIVAAVVLLIASVTGPIFFFQSGFGFVIGLYVAAVACNIVQARFLRKYKRQLDELALARTKLYKRARIGTTVSWVLSGVALIAVSPLIMFVALVIAVHH